MAWKAWPNLKKSVPTGSSPVLGPRQNLFSGFLRGDFKGAKR